MLSVELADEGTGDTGKKWGGGLSENSSEQGESSCEVESRECKCIWALWYS